MRRFGIILSLGTLAIAGGAQADAPELEVDRAAQVIVTDPNYQQQGYQQQGYQQPPQQGPGVQVVEETNPAQQGRGLEYGGSLFVPVWTGVPADSWNPGLGLDLRAGWELGRGLSIDGHVGFTYNGERGASAYGSSLQGVYLGAGLRYAFLNRSSLVPFLQAGLQFNMWSYSACSSCKSTYDTYNFGAYGGLGLIVEVNQNMSIDFGMNAMGALGSAKGFFTAHDLVLQPFIGASLYY